MGYRARPSSGFGGRRLLGSLLIAALFAALLAIVPGSPAASAAEVSKKGTLGDGYFFVATDGGIFNFGDSEFFGSTGDIRLNQPIVGAESTPTGEGYWLVASDGGIFTFGDAKFFGSTGDIRLNKPIVAMVATPTGQGYWLFATDGGVFTFGDAKFFGSTGDIRLNQPIVGADVTPTGLGYYLVAADGGIFTFGDAEFFGSAGSIKLNKPIVGMAALDDGDGYYLVATDGGIFSYGRTSDDAQFFGSTGAMTLNQPIVGMDLTASNQGYYLVAADGGIFSFGDAKFYGSTGNLTLNKPIVGMRVTPNSPVAAPDFVVDLAGNKEAPGPGDADASGFALIDVSDDEVCWNLKVNSLDDPATAAHIHRGPAGVAGPIVVTLTKPDENGTSTGCVDVDKSVAAALLANPAGYYVNVHTNKFPGGAARGQLEGHIGIALVAPAAGSTKASVLAFDTENPGSADAVQTFETNGAPIAAADFKPGTTDAYVLLVSGATQLTLVKVALDGTATVIGNVPVSNAGAGFGADFDPATGLLHVVSTANDNLTVNPATAATTAGPTLAYVAGDPSPNPDPSISGIGYTNVAGAATQQLFGIDDQQDTVVLIDPATGTVTTVGTAGTSPNNGELGIDVTSVFGFDISAAPANELGTSLFAGQLTGGTGSSLLAVDRTTGRATNIGQIGTESTTVVRAFSILNL